MGVGVPRTPAAAPADRAASEGRAGDRAWTTRLGLPRSRRALIVTGSAILVLVVALTVVLVSGGTSHTVSGTLQLADTEGLAQYQDGDACSGSGGFSDIQGGAQVTVLNQDNSVIGTGRLGDGVMAGGYCRFPFTVSNTSAADTYQVEVGGSDSRGVQRFSDADLSRDHYKVTLSLGDTGPVPPRPACPGPSQISITASLQDVATYDFLPGKEDVSWRFTATNDSAVDVYISGTTTLVFPNGQYVENNSYFPNALKAGESWDPGHLMPESFVEVPSSWGKPSSIRPSVDSVKAQTLCK